MDLRILESLGNAVPVVLRHLDAYVELAAEDFAVAKSIAVARLRALMLLGVSGVFTLVLICVLVIALTWDGPYRVLAIGIMAGAFAIVAVGSATSFLRKRDEPFASLKREWQQDRALVQRILSQQQAQKAEHV